MKKIFAPKLKEGDMIRVVAPSMSMKNDTREEQEAAIRSCEKMGFRVSLGKHVHEMDELGSSSITSRREDLHDAFRDSDVKVVWAYKGGFNSNQLLSSLDWCLIRDNPKIIIGYSDITSLNNAIFAKTGLVTYSGPTFGGFSDMPDYEAEYLKKCLTTDKPFEIHPSKEWVSASWGDEEDQRVTPNDGYWAMQGGEAKGTILGANLITFVFLKGTPYFPSFPKDTILFLEDDYEEDVIHFGSILQSLLLVEDFKNVRGIVIGRLQKASGMSREQLAKILSGKKELHGLPVLANVDFGHTSPKVTFPVGGTAKIVVKKDNCSLEIVGH